MSVKHDQVPITSPCPIELDRSTKSPADRQLFCEHCTKDVHLLSRMTEGQARDFLRVRDGENICVSYAIKPDGGIRFRPEPNLVPPSALARRARGPAAMVASLGAAVLLSGCAPHVDPEAESTPSARVEVDHPQDMHVAGGLEAPPPEKPCNTDDTLVEGEIEALPLPDSPLPTAHLDDTMVDGGMIAAPVPNPPQPNSDDTMVEGGLKAAPVPQPVALPHDTLASGGMIAAPLPDAPVQDKPTKHERNVRGGTWAAPDKLDELDL